MGERGVDLLRHAVEDADVVCRPAAVELAQAEIDVAADRDEGAVAVDEGDDGTDEGVVDVREIRREVLQQMRGQQTELHR